MTIREQIERAKQQEFLTVEQVALLFQYNQNTIYKKIARHQIPGVRRHGRAIRFEARVIFHWGKQSLERRDLRPAASL